MRITILDDDGLEVDPRTATPLMIEYLIGEAGELAFELEQIEGEILDKYEAQEKTTHVGDTSSSQDIYLVKYYKEGKECAVHGFPNFESAELAAENWCYNVGRRADVVHHRGCVVSFWYSESLRVESEGSFDKPLHTLTGV